jgi:uncharacterized membrane protein YvbJ
MAVKICPNCNEQFDETTVTCKYCGQPTVRSEDRSAAVEKNKSRTYLYIAIALIIIVLIALFTMIDM